jgi:hypothetical protein
MASGCAQTRRNRESATCNKTRHARPPHRPKRVKRDNTAPVVLTPQPVGSSKRSPAQKSTTQAVNWPGSERRRWGEMLSGRADNGQIRPQTQPAGPAASQRPHDARHHRRTRPRPQKRPIGPALAPVAGSAQGLRPAGAVATGWVLARRAACRRRRTPVSLGHRRPAPRPHPGRLLLGGSDCAPT